MKFEYLLFIVYLIVQPVGQLLQRVGMKQVGAINGLSLLFSTQTAWKVITTPAILIGFCLSVSGFLLWLAVISNFKMSYIYPLSSIGYIIMAFMATVFLKETMTLTQWIGTGVIVLGCVLLNLK